MPHENINDAKVWLSYAQDDLGVAKHLFNTYLNTVEVES
jgi:hypothetical protein